MLASANKLSVVKRKGKSPHFNSQKQNANDNKAEDSGQTENKWSKHGKKKPRTEKSSGHNHSHLVSVGALVPSPPPAPVVYLWAKDIPANTPLGSSVMTGNKDHLFYQPLSHMGLKQGAQAFTGAPTTRTDTFPHVNAARDLAGRNFSSYGDPYGTNRYRHLDQCEDQFGNGHGHRSKSKEKGNSGN